LQNLHHRLLDAQQLWSVHSSFQEGSTRVVVCGMLDLTRRDRPFSRERAERIRLRLIRAAGRAARVLDFASA
jgi:hypothetical protein